MKKIYFKKQKKFSNYQIWRPFNLVGSNYNSSDHFYNILFKKMFIEKKNFTLLKEYINDRRGYSSADEFTTVILKYSKINKSFVKDFGNPELVKISEIINLFNKKYFQLNKKYFEFEFLSNKRNSSKIKLNKNNVYSKSDTISIFKNYLRNSLNVKKM